jgi:hypothetical protein
MLESIKLNKGQREREKERKKKLMFAKNMVSGK